MNRLIIFIIALTALSFTLSAYGESPRSMALEIKFGPMFPSSIDDEASLGGAKPFKEIFGSDSNTLMEAEFGYEFFQKFGSLSAIAGIGYIGFTGKALVAVQGDNGEIVPSTTTSEDTTKFKIIPLSIGAAYRFDYPYRQYDIPLIPYVKGGLDYFIWRSLNPVGDVTELSGGASAAGGKKGYFFSAGLQLSLDFIDRDAANHFDASSGINDTYIFAEYASHQVNNFGGDGLDLSYSNFMFGLMFEF